MPPRHLGEGPITDRKENLITSVKHHKRYILRSIGILSCATGIIMDLSILISVCVRRSNHGLQAARIITGLAIGQVRAFLPIDLLTYVCLNFA